MLTTTKKISITGITKINGINVCTHTASINSENPKALALGRVITNQNLYKENHETCIAEQVEFESYAYSVQDEMIASANDEEVSEEALEE